MMGMELGGWKRGRVSAATREVDRGRRLVLLLLVVYLAQHCAVLQPELVALVEGRVTNSAREALHVEDQVTCAHHHLGEQDGGLTSGTTLHAKQPATKDVRLLRTQELVSSSVLWVLTLCS